MSFLKLYKQCGAISANCSERTFQYIEFVTLNIDLPANDSLDTLKCFIFCTLNIDLD